MASKIASYQHICIAMQHGSVIPPFLKPGDTVALVATARFVDETMVETASRYYTKWGFKVHVHDELLKRNFQLAGSDAHRANVFNEALQNPSVKAIAVLRGGYGTVRILDCINAQAYAKCPKWLVGYSDVTVLHCWSQYLGIASIHASMPVNFDQNTPEALDSLRAALNGSLTSLKCKGAEGIRNGQCSGKLVGGNLSVLYSLAGSPYFKVEQGSILFIEDLDEHLYHLDRMMMNLKVSGQLQKCGGIIVGGMSDMRDNTKEFGFSADNPFGFNAREIIESHTANLHIPVAWGFCAGHIADNRAMYLNRHAELRVEDQSIELSWSNKEA